MRIHLQNPPGETLFSFSEAMWDAATGRAGSVGSGHTVSIGQTAEDFAEAMLTAEALVADAGVIRGLLPLHAPRLKLVFATNAGLEASVVVGEVRAAKPGHGINIDTGEMQDLVKSGIIDPTKVTRSALQNAASIAKNILTTECVVVDAPEKPGSAPMGMPDMGGMM